MGFQDYGVRSSEFWYRFAKALSRAPSFVCAPLLFTVFAIRLWEGSFEAVRDRRPIPRPCSLRGADFCISMVPNYYQHLCINLSDPAWHVCELACCRHT